MRSCRRTQHDAQTDEFDHRDQRELINSPAIMIIWPLPKPARSGRSTAPAHELVVSFDYAGLVACCCEFNHELLTVQQCRRAPLLVVAKSELTAPVVAPAKYVSRSIHCARMAGSSCDLHNVREPNHGHRRVLRICKPRFTRAELPHTIRAPA